MSIVAINKMTLIEMSVQYNYASTDDNIDII